MPPSSDGDFKFWDFFSSISGQPSCSLDANKSTDPGLNPEASLTDITLGNGEKNGIEILLTKLLTDLILELKSGLKSEKNTFF